MLSNIQPVSTYERKWQGAQTWTGHLVQPISPFMLPYSKLYGSMKGRKIDLSSVRREPVLSS